MANSDFSDLFAKFNQTTDELIKHFAVLNETQLNWQADSTQWSIGQCIDHLIVTNSYYFPILEKVLKGENKTFWEKMPFLPSFFGNMLLSFLEPKARKKLKAPKVFEPTASKIDLKIVVKFEKTQKSLSDLIKQTEHLPLNKIIITSPVSQVVTYSLLDAYKIITTHDRRHLDQAINIYNLTNFPSNS